MRFGTGAFKSGPGFGRLSRDRAGPDSARCCGRVNGAGVPQRECGARRDEAGTACADVLARRTDGPLSRGLGRPIEVWQEFEAELLAVPPRRRGSAGAAVIAEKQRDLVAACRPAARSRPARQSRTRRASVHMRERAVTAQSIRAGILAEACEGFCAFRPCIDIDRSKGAAGTRWHDNNLAVDSFANVNGSRSPVRRPRLPYSAERGCDLLDRERRPTAGRRRPRPRSAAAWRAARGSDFSRANSAVLEHRPHPFDLLLAAARGELAGLRHALAMQRRPAPRARRRRRRSAPE